MNLIVSVDHGNKAIKNTVNQYSSGFAVSSTAPISSKNLLEYKGKYYSISADRFPVMTDKTVNDNFFILTLPSIAEVLAKEYGGTTNGEIILACGLPIMYYGKQKEKFKQYFIREGVAFTYEGDKYRVSIKDAHVFPQGYAAIMDDFGHYKGISRLNIVDIGGYTVDFFTVEKGLLNLKTCMSLPTGVVTLLNSIRQEVLASGVEIIEQQIEEIILGEDISFFQNEFIKELIMLKTENYVGDLLDRLKEHSLEMKINPTVFLGGGALLLRRFIENSKRIGYIEFLENAVGANASGYKLLAEQAAAKSR